MNMPQDPGDQLQTSEPLNLSGSLALDDRNFLMLSSDQKWLQPNQCFIPSALDFDLISGGRGRQYASTAELVSDLRNRSYYHGPELKVTCCTLGSSSRSSTLHRY